LNGVIVNKAYKAVIKWSKLRILLVYIGDD
jgi:hypothetical protein